MSIVSKATPRRVRSRAVSSQRPQSSRRGRARSSRLLGSRLRLAAKEEVEEDGYGDSEDEDRNELGRAQPQQRLLAVESQEADEEAHHGVEDEGEAEEDAALRLPAPGQGGGPPAG